MTVDIHRADPHWDYDEDENPRPDSSYLARSAVVRSHPPRAWRSAGITPTVPAQREPENRLENAR